MTEREYKDGKFRPERRTFHIYCTACDFLVFICDNTEKCADKHLNGCIAKIEERRVIHYRSILWKRKINRALSSKNKINKLYYNNSYYLNCNFRKDLSGYDKLQAEEIMKEIVVRITNSAIAIQRAWRAFKLDQKHGQNEKINPQTQEEYDFYTDEYVNCLKKAYNKNIAQKYIKEYLTERATRYKEYIYYSPSYRIITYGDWSLILKCLANPEYHHISKVDNNIVINFVKSSEYARYMCKKAGKQYPCDSLEIDYFKSGYNTTERKSNIIDFSDLNNNFIQRAYRNYKKRPKSLAKWIWEAVRNDGTPDDKKYLGITSCISYIDWEFEKKNQLYVRLANVTYDI
ncbi:hypothetical protein RhiirA4_488704, partial [Rhizophagus irregularis]